MIFSYLNNHKEWIFSGIGITIILAVIQILKKIVLSIVWKYRLKRTPKQKFFNKYPLQIYDFYFSKNEKDNEPTQNFIQNCSIKTHSLVLKSLKKELLNYDSLIWIDIDKFTQINNTFGVECGDIIINTILKILYVISKKYECKIYHAIKRDEFYIVISEMNLDECARHFLVLIQQYEWSEIIPNLFVTCSVGIASNRIKPVDTLKRARVSLNLVKARGGNNIGPQILKLHPYILINLNPS